MASTKPPYHWLRAESDQLVAQAADLAGLVHGPGVRDLTLALARDFPGGVEVLVAVESASGSPVSLLVLIPWTWRLGKAELRVSETGIVATHPDHRHRGLSSALMELAAARRRQRGEVISVIQGIPGFYRRFGYTYAAPLEVHDNWALEALPPCPQGWQCRDAAPEDLPQLERWLAPDPGAPLAAVRGPEHWRFRMGPGRDTATAADFRIVVDDQGQPAGVWAQAREGFGEGLIVCEAGAAPGSPADRVWASVAWDAGARAQSQSKPHVRLNLGSLHPLTVWARARGAVRTGTWHWQIRLDDPQAALDQTAADWGPRWPAQGPATIVLNLYGGQAVLRAPGGREGGESGANLTPEVLTQLLFGWKDPRSLREFFPDFFGEPGALEVLDALFPARDGFCGSVY